METVDLMYHHPLSVFRQWFSTRGKLSPRRHLTCGGIFSVIPEVGLGISQVEVKAAAKVDNAQDSLPAEDHSASNVSRAEAE